MSLYANAVAAERAAKIVRDIANHEAGINDLRAENAALRAALYDEQHGISFHLRDARMQQLETALRLMLECGELAEDADADLEGMLESYDKETRDKANAWLVAREALRPNAALTGAEGVRVEGTVMRKD